MGTSVEKVTTQEVVTLLEVLENAELLSFELNVDTGLPENYGFGPDDFEMIKSTLKGLETMYKRLSEEFRIRESRKLLAWKGQ